MALKIDEARRGDVTLLALTGHVTMGPEASGLKDRVGKLVAAGNNRVVMNLEAVNYIDSFGLGEMVACLTTIKKSGGSLALVRPDEFVRQVLRTTRLDTVFSLYDSDEAAVAGFDAPDRADSPQPGAEG